MARPGVSELGKADTYGKNKGQKYGLTLVYMTRRLSLYLTGQLGL